jgi:hypothetical protein
VATGIAPASAASSLDTVLTGTVYVKLHLTDPGAAGANGAAVNTTRAPVTFAAASGGSKTSNADATWTSVSTTETYAFFSLWTASSGGTFLYSGTVTGGAVTAGQDFKIPSGSLVANITPAA